MTNNGNLLVVDWDYFFPNPTLMTTSSLADAALYDWTCREDANHREPLGPMALTIWGHRASAFLAARLPLPQPDPAWRTFWDRFTLAPHAQIHIADSNVYAYDTASTMPMVENVDLYDAHHDAAAYPAPGNLPDLHCGNWLTALEEDYGLDGAHVHLPPWRDNPHAPEHDPAFQVLRTIDDGKPVPHVYDAVFICRSPAWVPPWCDNAFEEFVTHPKLMGHLYVIDEDYTGPRNVPLAHTMSAISMRSAMRGRMGPTAAKGTLHHTTAYLAQQADKFPTHPDLRTIPCELTEEDMQAFWPAFLPIPHNDQAALDALVVSLGHPRPTLPPEDAPGHATADWHAHLVHYPEISCWDIEWTWTPDPDLLPADSLRHYT